MAIKRKYKRITPKIKAEHLAQQLISGNGAAAIRDVDDDYMDGQEYDRAYKIALAIKSDSVSTAQYIDDSLEQIGATAIQRVNMLVQSGDERIATKNAHYVLDHIRGKAVQRSISVTTKLNIQSVLD